MKLLVNPIHGFLLLVVKCNSLGMNRCLNHSDQCEMVPKIVNRYVPSGDPWCKNNCKPQNANVCEKQCECLEKGSLIARRPSN